MLCIYCKQREAEAREHHLPQCLGRFDNYECLYDRLCNDCNHEIGGRHLHMFGLDTDGRTVLWQTSQQPGTLKEISQVIIRDADDNAIEHIPIPTEIKTASELVEILYKRRNATFIEKAQVIAASGDEERVQALFAAINVNVTFQRRKGGVVNRQFFVGSTHLNISEVSLNRFSLRASIHPDHHRQ